MYPPQVRIFYTTSLSRRARFLVTEEKLLVVEDMVCFFVYRLALDAKPDRGMMYPSENTRACSRDFQTDTASMARKRHFASGARGFSGFCLLLPFRRGVGGEAFHRPIIR